MATQMQLARQGVITEAMKIVAEQEHVTPEFIREGVAKGTIAIPCNINHKNLIPRGVGTGLTVKVNANIGTSSSYPDPAPELEKLQAAIDAVKRNEIIADAINSEIAICNHEIRKVDIEKAKTEERRMNYGDRKVMLVELFRTIKGGEE